LTSWLPRRGDELELTAAAGGCAEAGEVGAALVGGGGAQEATPTSLPRRDLALFITARDILPSRLGRSADPELSDRSGTEPLVNATDGATTSQSVHYVDR